MQAWRGKRKVVGFDEGEKQISLSTEPRGGLIHDPEITTQVEIRLDA